MPQPGGFIKLHRSFLEWEWYDDINTKVLWLHLLLTAHYKPYKWRGKTIMPGQVVTGLEKLGQQTKMTIQEVRTALGKLKATGEITIESTNKGTVVTLVNWGKYQSSDGELTSKTIDHATLEQQTNNKPTTNEQQLLKNLKNYKKEEVGEETRLFQLLLDNHGSVNATAAAATAISDWVDIVGAEVVEMAILITAKNNGKKPFGYIEKKIRDWDERGLRSRDDIEAYLEGISGPADDEPEYAKRKFEGIS